MIVNHAIEAANRVKPVEIIYSKTNFIRKIFIDNKSQLLRKVRRDHAYLVILMDRSILNDSRYGVARYKKTKLGILYNNK